MKKDSAKSWYDHATLIRWLRERVVQDWLGGGAEVVAGVEIGLSFPDKEKALAEYYALAGEILNALRQTKDVATPEGRREMQTSIIIERVKAFRPSQTRSAMTAERQGMGLEMWRAHFSWLERHGLRWRMWLPRSWQAEVLAGVPGNDPKARAQVAAQQLFPRMKLPSMSAPAPTVWTRPGATVRAYSAHQGIVDAVLIAEATRRHFWPERRVEAAPRAAVESVDLPF